MKIKKKEDQSVDTLFLLRMGNKISMEGVTAPPGDASHKQPPNSDTIAYVSKILLAGP